MAVAKELKNDNVLADIQDTQGKVLFFHGDPKAAKDLYQRALQTATRAKDQNRVLVSKFDIARADIALHQAQGAVSALKQIITQADSAGLKYLYPGNLPGQVGEMENTRCHRTRVRPRTAAERC